MALTGNETKMTIFDYSRIDMQDICQFCAEFSTSDPDSYTLSRTIIDKDLYKGHLKEVLVDESTFHEQIFSLIDEIKEDKNGTAK